MINMQSVKPKGEKMKKIFTLGMVLTVVTTAANAGWLEKLGFGKSSEPATLEEACNKDDLTAICPDMILGSQTMMGCLSDNVTSLSKKCAKFVKKYITENKDEIITTATETSGSIKEAVANAKAESKESSAQKKAEIKQQKAELKKTAAELKAAAKQTGKDFKETGESLKEIAK